MAQLPNLRNDPPLRIMGSMDHKEWYERTTSGASGLEASRRAGLPTSTLNRQLAKGVLSPEFVIELARAYESSPPIALAETGFLTMEEVTGADETVAADLLSDRELIRQLAHRINSDPAAWFGTFGELADEATVHELPPTLDVEGLPYASDSSKTEPELGDDDFHDGP